MPRSGLSKRLQQQSRRSGFAVGISMVVAIAICFATFTWIYVQLEPWVQDFAGAEEAPPTATARPAAESEDAEEGDEPPAPTPTSEPQGVPDGEDEPPIEEAPDDEEESDQFEPDYVVSAGQDVNFRSEPSTAAGGATVIEPIADGTPLQATGETAPADSPDNGPWIQFELEDGTEGWLREVDVSPT